jgi:hypothetical protein
VLRRRPRRDPRRWLAFAVLAWAATATGDEIEDLIGGFDDKEATEAPAESPPPDDDLDDLIGGFEEDEPPAEATAPPGEHPPEEPSFWKRWRLSGSTGFQASVNYLSHDSLDGTDWTGVSMLRAKLALQLDGDLPGDWKLRVDGFGFYDFAFLINDRDDFTSQVLDQYEWDVLLQDAYVQGSLRSDLDLKIGRQVVNWPLDNRQPGIGDLEDLRLSVAMLRADYYVERWSLTALLIPEIRFNKQPVFGHDFFPSPVPLPPEDRPAAPTTGARISSTRSQSTGSSRAGTSPSTSLATGRTSRSWIPARCSGTATCGWAAPAPTTRSAAGSSRPSWRTSTGSDFPTS